MRELLNISEVSEMLGVVKSTLREWDHTGVLKSVRTAGGHRRYKLSDVKNMQNGVNFICKKKCDDVTNLTKKHPSDAGLDIKSNDDYIVPPQDSKLISTGLYLQIPNGFVGLIWPRSGLSVKNKVEIGAGCIDATYRGEVKVHLYNFGKEDFYIKKGDRIAQLLTIPVCLNEYVAVDTLDETERSQSGFGSTGA